MSAWNERGAIDLDRVAAAWVRAAVAGLAAGIVMAMFAMLAAWAAGDGLWGPPRGITGMFVGEEYAGSGFAFGSVAGGMLIHMMLSAIFGVIYVVIVDAIALALGVAGQFVTGMAWGAIL